MPRKETTPDSPAIEASEEYINVEVTPKDESTKLVINYTIQKAILIQSSQTKWRCLVIKQTSTAYCDRR